MGSKEAPTKEKKSSQEVEEQSWNKKFFSVGVFLFAFLFYFITLAPSVDFIDAGELATVTHTLGIAHPTGYPLFTMIGWLWSRMPFGDEIVRMNLLSAVFCAAGAAIGFEVIFFLLGITNAQTRASGKTKQKLPKKIFSKALSQNVRIAIALAGAFAIAFSETVWSTALSIEVYSLHCFLLITVLYFFIRATFEKTSGDSFWGREKFWMLFALTLGISFTNHVTTIMLAPACLCLFFARNGFRVEAWKKILLAIPAFITGLLPYLYLPIRASQQPTLNWGNPSTLERFLWHVSGKQYSTWIFSSKETAWRQMKYFLSSFPSEFGYALLPMILLGIYFVFRCNKLLGCFLTLLFLGCILFSINYDIHDIESYFLLAYITCGIFTAFGMYALHHFWVKQSKHLFIVAALSTGILIGVQFDRVSQKGNYLVEDYTMNMFHSLAPNAFVLSYQWDYWVSASLYYQHVRGMRNDLVIIDKELLRRSWYFEQLRNNHPDIYAASRGPIETFLAELYKFEHNLPYAPEMIESRFNGMINDIIEKQYQRRPVYLTIEIEEQFAPGFIRVPEGLAFKLYKQIPSTITNVKDDFVYRAFPKEGRLIDGINSMYSSMLTSRGKYLHLQQAFDAAAPYFEKALKFNPQNPDAYEWKSKNEEARAKSKKLS